MAHTFSDEAKEFEGGDGDWLGFGVHEVQVSTVTEGTTDSGTDYIEFEVVGENEETDTARVWLTEKSEKYSFDTLRKIYVHCAPDDKKDKAREEFDTAASSTDVVELLQKCLGEQIWFTKYPDPERTYINGAGETKQSINKNIYGYEPRLREDLMPKNEQATNGTKDSPLKGSKPASDDEKAKIPKKW